MMTKTIRTGIAVAALLIVPIAAQAADLPRPSYKAPAYVAPFSWTGFYVGINGGYGWGNASVSDAITAENFDTRAKGWLGGGTVGYNYQTGSWVWGVEGDFDFSSVKGTNTIDCNAPGCEFRNNWLATGRGRIGYAWDRWLPFITGGAAYGDLKLTTPRLGGTSETTTKLGWTIGAGVEYALMGAWSIKAEYLYVDLGDVTCSPATCGPGSDTTIKLPLNIARLGVNYRF